MSEMCFKNAYFTIKEGAGAEVDLSDHVTSLTIDYKAEILDKTAMGDDSRARISGLKDWNLSVEFNQDFEVGKVDETMFPLVGSSETVTVRIRAENDTVSAANPEYSGAVVVESYPPLGGGVGELAKATASMQGDGTLARATS